MRNKVLRNKRVLSAALFVLLLIVAGVTNLKAQNNTSYSIEAVPNPAEGGTVTITTYTQGEEKVINGDFEQGNVDFTSEYVYDGYGSYSVDDSADFGAGIILGHGGTGNFMILDGATEPGVNVWMEQISVVPNTYYAFSTWVCTLYPESMAMLQFSINGTQVGVFRAPSQTNTWEQFYVIWYSGNSTTATITILDQNTEGGGNDFGLDDISFRELVMVETTENAAYVESGETCSVTAIPNEGYTFYQWKENGNVISMENPISFVALFNRSLEACFLESSTYPLLYSFNENDRTATVTGFWDGYDAAGDLTIPETVMHNGEVYTVTTIGESAFYGRSEITSVEFPNSLISIAYGAFEACEGITEVVIPSSVTSIGEGPFMWCRNLVQITVEPGNTYYDSRDNCYAIIETATNKLVAGSLSTIIPPTVTSIGLGAFGGLQISSITIPALVNHIRDNAFIGASLSSIIVLAEMPPFAGACAFCVADRNIPVYVPCGSLDAYQNDGGWNEFPNFIGMCPGTIAVTANPAEYGTVTGGGSFEGGETCTVTAVPNEGYFFECWKENNQIVSTQVTYSFVVTGDRNLTASFYTPQPGMLNGQFSIGENQLVCFSQGNLQYQASTNTWRFAENQWDYVGNATLGTVYENDVKCDNSLISSTYDGWIDLFGWGTSGHNHGAVCYQPWCTNENNGEYVAYDKWQTNLFEQTGQADWGSNAISNGGNQPNQWRTLNRDEWVYVFDTRTTPTGIRWTKGNVNGVNGVILLPDDWDATYYTLNDANGGYYNSNDVSSEDWTDIFEANGAVFLPAAAQRVGTWVRPEGSYNYDFGVYWSSSWCNDDNAYNVYLHPDGLNVWDNWQRCIGRSVRLIRPAQDNASYSIEAEPNPAQGGSVTGTGTYNYYNQVTLTANANEGYTFYQWKENGSVISMENPISFVALFNRNLEAVFLESSTYPLLYSFNEEEHTATVTGHWDGQNATGDLVIPETVMHNGESYTVTTIGGYAFYGCSGLTGSLTIPNTVTGIGDEAFNFCSGFTGELVIPNSVTYIGWGAFSDCNGFNSINMGTSVTYIGGYAFNGCSNVASLELSNSLTDIGDWAFNGCSSLTSVVFPNSLNFIREWAFRSCHGLTEVVIPSSVTSIGVNPFANCSNLAQITVEAGNSYYDSRGNCNAIIETGTNTLVSGSQNTIIPNTVTHIGQDAFNEILVSSITFPASVNYIGEGAIMNIPTLSTMTVLAEVPPTLDYCAFCDMDHSIPVYVPCGSLEMYQNAEGWNEFSNIQEGWYDIELSTNTAEGGMAIGGGEYCLGSTCTVTAEANEDFYFVNWTDNGEIVSTESTYSFTVADNRTLVANFEEGHWTAESYENYMFMIGVVQIDGVEQTSPNLELGAFCNGECRGTKSPVYDEGQWLYFMNIGGNAGDEITFRVYDHALQQELNLYCFNVLPFELYGLIGIDEPYEILFASTLAVSADVNPENAGTIEGEGEYPLGAEATLTATANAGYAFNSWTLDGEVISTEPSYTFTVTAPVSLTANFDVLYSVLIDVNIEEAGTVTGEGEYLYGTSVTVAATPNEGYAFNSWTLEGEIVSTEPTYTFTVTEPVNLTANFDIVQTYQLTTGGNWWSTHLEITLDDLKAALVEALPNTVITIKSKGQNTKYNNGRWSGQLTSLDATQMYCILVSTDCEITVKGAPINYAEHPVTIIGNGITWLGFPLSENMLISDALSGFSVVNGDIIKSKTNNAIYNRGAWRGALTTFEPGKGYKFLSNGMEDRTLTFPTSTK